MKILASVFLFLLFATCAPPPENPLIEKRYFGYQCAWCGYFEGSSERMTCYLEDGTYHTQDELLMEPDIWYHFVCCDSWWGGQDMCYNSGMCNTCMSWAADVPPQTAQGCSSEPWNEIWNPYCSVWNKQCYTGECN